MLQWPLEYMDLFWWCFSPGMYPGVGLQDCLAALFLVFWRISKRRSPWWPRQCTCPPTVLFTAVLWVLPLTQSHGLGWCLGAVTATHIHSISFKRNRVVDLCFSPSDPGINFFTTCEVSWKCFSTLPNFIITLIQIPATNLPSIACSCTWFQRHELRNGKLQSLCMLAGTWTWPDQICLHLL